MKQANNQHVQAPTWCPGCGNFAIWKALQQALADLKIPSHKTLVVFGVGCAGNMANTIPCYGWHSLHGRALPTGVGAKLANNDLTVIVAAGDGDSYGEGMGHFIHALRGNVDVTYIVHDNSVYGLTTGQAAPTAQKGFKAKSTPDGIIDAAVNPLALAMAAGCSFVARGFSGHADHLTEVMKAAIMHRGFSLVDVFQPCVTFNKLNTYGSYYDRVYELEADQSYDIHDYRTRNLCNMALLQTAQFLVTDARSEALGPFFVGEVKRGTLKPGMEAEWHTMPLVIEQIYADFSGKNVIESARRGIASLQVTAPGIIGDDIKGEVLVFKSARTVRKLAESVLLQPKLTLNG